MKYRSNWWAQIARYLHKRTGIVLFIFTILLASCEDPGLALSGLTGPEQPEISRGLELLPIPSAPPLTPARGDFDTLVTTGNTRPTDIWSNGTTVWVSDFDDGTIYAYNLRSKARDEAMDFVLDAMNDRPTSLWSDGTTMWVANNTVEPIITPWMTDEEREAASSIVDKIFAYRMSDGERDVAKDFALIAGNDFPSGIWSDGTTMWVADFEDSKLYAYDLRSKTHDASMDFVLDAMNDRPASIWSDGNTIWVADARDDQLYAYNLSDGAVNESEAFPTLDPMNTNPVGIWSDGSTMWVADTNVDKIFAYNLSDKSYTP